jgi:hypothetical protein
MRSLLPAANQFYLGHGFFNPQINILVYQDILGFQIYQCFLFLLILFVVLIIPLYIRVWSTKTVKKTKFPLISLS